MNGAKVEVDGMRQREKPVVTVEQVDLTFAVFHHATQQLCFVASDPVHSNSTSRRFTTWLDCDNEEMLNYA